MRHRFMVLATALTTVAAIATWSGIAAGAQGSSRAKVGKHPTLSAHIKRHAGTAVHPTNLKLLYSQYGGIDSILSTQDFETAFSPYDSEIADDFTVPAGQTWKVQLLDVNGQENGGPVGDASVSFYADAGGPYGGVIAIRRSHKITDSAGALSIKFSAVTLGPGTYWVGVHGDKDYVFNGQWWAAVQNTVTGSMAYWENPGNGFGSGCTSLQPVSCVGYNGDMSFDLQGHLG